VKKSTIIIIVIAVVIFLSAGGSILWWVNQATIVAQNEFGPQAALQKYEWFIDQANAIAKADKDIALFEQKRVDIETQYDKTYGTDRSKWSPSIQAQYNQAIQTGRDDLIAVVSNRNGLVKEYNAQSEKFNWEPFMTRSDLPQKTFSDYVVK